MVADQNEKLLNESAEKLRGEGHNVLAVTCDVSDKAQVAAMIDLAVKTYGWLDAAFNNAGINCAATPMEETDDEVFDRLININLRGAWNCMKGEPRQMISQAPIGRFGRPEEIASAVVCSSYQRSPYAYAAGRDF